MLNPLQCKKKAKLVAGIMITGQKVSVMSSENATKDQHGDEGDRKASGS